MGKFEFHGIDDFMEGLSELDVDRIAPVMLEEAVPILEKEVRQAAGRHKLKQQKQGRTVMDIISVCVLQEWIPKA